MNVEDLIGKKIADNVSKMESLTAEVKRIDETNSKTENIHALIHNGGEIYRLEIMIELYVQANNDLLEILSAYRQKQG